MTNEQMMKLFADTAYIRTGGSADERRCADYILSLCRAYDPQAALEPFEVDMATIRTASLEVFGGDFGEGEAIECKGYLNAGSREIEAPFCYLTAFDRLSLLMCKGKIALFDGYLGYWKYQDLLEHGAVGFISYDGNANYADRDIDQRELRSYVSRGNKIPGVNINAKSAIELVNRGAERAKITLRQDEYKGSSYNVVMNLAGESEEYLLFTAHYDSTSLSEGAYDNMSGCIGLLAIAEYFAHHPHKYSMRFLFCGSEERGLLGSKAYCEAHREALSSCVLNINLDMIGSIMGRFIACCSTEAELVSYLSYMSLECGFQLEPYQDVYSSDSTPLADCGVPAVSFARSAPANTATIHNRYDTAAVIKAEQMAADIDFIIAFADRMANAAKCPIKREIPEQVKEKLDRYLARKR